MERPDWCPFFGGLFSNCTVFEDKDQCWVHWDKLHEEEEE